MKLFEPITLRGMQLKNRILMAAMHVNMGLRGRRSRAYYVERARGGVGAIVTGGVPVDVFISDEPWGQPGGAATFREGVGRLAQEVQEAGARLGMQLWHGNNLPQGMGEDDPRGEKVGPSATGERRALTVEEIHLITSKFAEAAARCREIGFDFVEFHGAHGYLACQFFSPADNHRTDEYGGDLAGRIRFGIECIKAMREATGADYPLFFRFPAEERREGGITLAESTRYAAELDKAGVDVFDVSIGSPAPFRPDGYSSPSKKYRAGTFVPLAEAVKREVKAAVAGVGKINTPEVAEAILSQGKTDLVAMGRQLIADPFWPKKVLEGRESEIVQCDSCNINCWRLLRPRRLPPDSSLCKFNERAGRELECPAPE